MTNEEAIQWLDAIKKYYIHGGDEAYDKKRMKAIDMAIKALEPKPMEKFDDVKTHIQRLAGDYKCWDNRLTWEEALELNRMLEAQPSEDCISRQAVLDVINFEDKWLFDANGHNANTHIAFNGLESRVKALPSVTPKYTDEEIDKAQAVEQAYVDKMVELAVEETKRPKGKWIGEKPYPICDKCGCNIYEEYISCSDFAEIYKPMNYCPNCGAEMGGADD